MGSIVTLTANPSVDVSTSVRALEPFAKMRCSRAEKDPGGGGINVARVVTRMGGDAVAVYPAGGLTGQWLNERLQRDGVRTRPIHVAGETREDFTVSEEATSSQYRFVLAGAPLAERELEECLRIYSQAVSQSRIVVASGSLPPDAPVNFFAQAARIAKDRGAKMIVDTSGPALAAALKEGVFLIKPNLHEFQDLLGHRTAEDGALLDAARSLIGQGAVEIIALTLGSEGALLISKVGAWRAEPLPIEPVSVVGAGDSFLGAMVWCLAEGRDLETALKYGVAAGSAALLNTGTELCNSDDVARLVPKVRVTPVPTPIASDGGP